LSGITSRLGADHDHRVALVHQPVQDPELHALIGDAHIARLGMGCEQKLPPFAICYTFRAYSYPIFGGANMARAVLAATAFLLFSYCSAEFKLVRTQITLHPAGESPVTTMEDRGKTSLQISTTQPTFTSIGQVKATLPATIQDDKEVFTASARIDGNWNLKTTHANINLGLILMGRPVSKGKGDPGPWLSGSQPLDVEVSFQVSLADGFVSKYAAGGKNIRSFSLSGHMGVGQTLSGFQMTFIYEEAKGEPDAATLLKIRNLEKVIEHFKSTEARMEKILKGYESGSLFFGTLYKTPTPIRREELTEYIKVMAIANEMRKPKPNFELAERVGNDAARQLLEELKPGTQKEAQRLKQVLMKIQNQRKESERQLRALKAS
jgi:hypothetical protein